MTDTHAPIPVHVTIDTTNLAGAIEEAVRDAVEQHRQRWYAEGFFEGQADAREQTDQTVAFACQLARLAIAASEPQDATYGWAQDFLKHYEDGSVPSYAQPDTDDGKIAAATLGVGRHLKAL